MKMSHICSSAILWSTLLAASAQQGVTQPILGTLPGPSQTTPSIQPAAPISNVSTSSTMGIDPSQYVIGLEDNLQITVWREPTLSGSIPVRPDGMISLALLGDVPAAGMTPMQLGANITSKLKKFVNEPNVTVTVLGVHPKQIYMVGEVGHVGAIQLVPGMTPLQAISAAGGLTAYANAKHIYILRGEAGKQKKIPFNYKIALKSGDQQGVVLLPGDTIVIP